MNNLTYYLSGVRNKKLSNAFESIRLSEMKTFNKNTNILISLQLKKSPKKIEFAKENNINIIYLYFLPIKYDNTNKNSQKNLIIDNILNNLPKKINLKKNIYYINFADYTYKSTITIIDKQNKIAYIYLSLLVIDINTNKIKNNNKVQNCYSFEHNNNYYFYDYTNNNKNTFNFIVTHNEPINIIKYDDYKMYNYFFTDDNTFKNPTGINILFIKDNKYNIFTSVVDFKNFELKYNNKYNKILPNFNDVIKYNIISYRYYDSYHYFITTTNVYVYKFNKYIDVYDINDVKKQMFQNYIDTKEKILSKQKNKYKRQPVDNIYIFNDENQLFNYFMKIFNKNNYKLNGNEKIKALDTIGYFSDSIILNDLQKTTYKL